MSATAALPRTIMVAVHGIGDQTAYETRKKARGAGDERR